MSAQARSEEVAGGEKTQVNEPGIKIMKEGGGGRGDGGGSGGELRGKNGEGKAR